MINNDIAIRFNFSCDETEIDLLPFMEKGYYDTNIITNIYMEPNISHASTIHVIKQITRNEKHDIMHFWYSKLPETPTIIDGKLLVPKQTNVFYASCYHPNKDEFVFSNLNNVTITNIVIQKRIDHCNNHEWRYNNECEMVMDLTLGRLNIIDQPFTPKWCDFYKKNKQRILEGIETQHRLTDGNITALFEGIV